GQGLALRDEEIDTVQRANRGAPRSKEPARRAIELLETVDSHRDLARAPLGRGTRHDPAPLPRWKLGGAHALRRVSGLVGHRPDANCLRRTPAGLDMGAARGKATADGAHERGSHLPGHGHDRRQPLVASERWKTLQEPPRVGVTRVREDVPDRPFLDELAGVRSEEHTSELTHT